MKDKKFVKVIFEWDNGDKYCLEGKQAQEWFDAINEHLLVSQLHGGSSVQPFEWKKLNQEPQPLYDDEDGYDDGGLIER